MFIAFGVDVPLAVVVQAFFVGMVANLAPAPAGVGGVDGGLIGAFALFGVEPRRVRRRSCIYRLIAFWLPIPPGIVAFFQLRKTVTRLGADRGDAGEEDEVSDRGPRCERAITSESKVTY